MGSDLVRTCTGTTGDNGGDSDDVTLVISDNDDAVEEEDGGGDADGTVDACSSCFDSS